MGLFDNRDEGVMAFEELLNLGTAPAQLRWIFILLAVEGNPVMSIWENHAASLSADIRDGMLRLTSRPDSSLIQNELLRRLQDLLQGLGRTLTDIGLPEPEERQLEVDAERLQWSGDPGNLCGFKDSLTAEQVRFQSRFMFKSCTSDNKFQRAVYNRIMEITMMDNPPPIHVDGRAGRGKTYVLYPVIGALRKVGEIVLLSASSAFAAKNYPGGRTTHYLYGIPVDEYKPFLVSSVGPKSDRARLLYTAKCHVIDEISGLHFKAFDCADRLMRGLTGSPNQVWGGRMLITVGDFRQVRFK
jgi:hypothetical protein